MTSNSYWQGFFEDDGTSLPSMNRLATFIAIVALTIGFFIILIFCMWAAGEDLRALLGALTTIGIIIAGLGGFNYAAGRAAGAYTQVRVEQAKQGIPGLETPPTPKKRGKNVGSRKY